MSDSPPIIVRITRRFEASAERVFDAWLDPAMAGKWLFATATGRMVKAEIDPRVGGSFSFTDRRDGVDVEHIGEYLEIDRPRRLVFTFYVGKATADASRVSVDIVALAAGCELILTHEMDAKWAEFAARTEAGWTMILQGLARSLGLAT
ncbi:MAG: SRPBCC domain-containing protein [Hyphomicrobiaceae bacterium]|nr:MAG: SRPBCC domain-containing protein [Hyphomicrobiaceae bacterium]